MEVIDASTEGAKPEASSATSIGNALSSLIPWHTRSHHRNTDEMADYDGDPHNVAVAVPHQTLSVASAGHDLRRRPFSFYHGDETNFDLVTSHRQRSASLSEICSPVLLVEQDYSDSLRPVSIDTARPGHVQSACINPSPDFVNMSMRVSSKSSVSTTIHRPESVEPSSKRVGDPSSIQGKRATKGGRKSKSIATAAARAAAGTSVGIRKENVRPTVITRKHGQENSKRNGGVSEG